MPAAGGGLATSPGSAAQTSSAGRPARSAIVGAGRSSQAPTAASATAAGSSPTGQPRASTASATSGAAAASAVGGSDGAPWAVAGPNQANAVRNRTRGTRRRIDAMIRGGSRARLAPVDAPGRIKALLARTARAFAPALARPDDAFAEAWLPEPERALYRAMDARDRDHGCRVARRLLRDHPDADATWVRAALLHDVGKSGAPYRAWERIAVHLVRGDARSRAASRWGGPALARAIERDRDHAAIGGRMLAAAGADPRVVELVAEHHRPRAGDPAAAALAAADAAADAEWRAVARDGAGSGERA